MTVSLGRVPFKSSPVPFSFFPPALAGGALAGRPSFPSSQPEVRWDWLTAAQQVEAFYSDSCPKKSGKAKKKIKK